MGRFLRSSPRRFYLTSLVLVAILRLPALVLPVIDTDEAGHGVCARELLAGGRLYVDYADNKPPLLYWIFAAVLWLSGGTNLAVHYLTLPWIVAGAWGIKRMLQAAGHGEEQGRWAFLAYLVGSSVYLPNDMLATNGEQLMNPFVVFAALAWWVPGRALPRGLVSGLAGCAAGLCYQKGWVILPLMALWCVRVLVRERNARRDAVTFLAGVSAGACGLLVVTAAALLRTGSLEPAIDWNLRSNVGYISAGLGLFSFSLEDRQPHGTIRVLFYLLANALPVKVIWEGMRSARGADSQDGRAGLCPFLLIWLAGSFLALSLGGRYFGHYFLQIVPAWSALFGMYMPAAVERHRQTGSRSLVHAGLPLGGLAAFAYVWTALGGLESQKPILHEVARHAAERCPPKERIFVWGYASPVYYYSARQPASRFVYPQSLAGYVPGHPRSMNPATDHRPFVVWKNWPLAVADLEEKKPAWIYDFAPTGFHYWGKFRLHDYPLGAFVDSLYTPADTVMGVVAYRRRG